MSPRADFVCLGKRCRGDDGAPTYELPISAKTCPVCGSKRLQRIWSANVNTGTARDRDKIVQPAFEHVTQSKRAARDARTSQRVSPALAVPMSRLGATLTSQFMGQQLGVPALTAGDSKPSPVPANASLLHVAGRTPRPGPDSRRWTPPKGAIG